MLYVRRFLQLRLSASSNRLSTTRIIALCFAGIILTGALLLTLPVASRSGESCGFLTALFTATSATCVTGLILVDTFVQWSGFGQIVILSLIQIGGLGFMSIASIFAFSLHKKLGLKQRMLLAQAMSLNDVEGVVRLQKHVLVGTFSLEGLGALILFFRFFTLSLPSAMRVLTFWESCSRAAASCCFRRIRWFASPLWPSLWWAVWAFLSGRMCSGRCVPAACAGCRCTPGWF